ncbi:glycosyltransferase family 2 protein [Phocaeicola coprophilus]|uniref:glycosyltransferase family 2 protein n=1 Tax=Phocaeicola coprophilus TaxID=387090 RepID=UPI00255C312D|nr:glycosyltransferase family 2 protein [Phocaeicola coprophilus]
MFPKISIIVPVYNAEQTLHRCVDSVINQLYQDWELLLINDGSTDTSGIICNEYSVRDSRIKVFHKPNGGVSSARNMGLDHAKGEWITFVDSDDFLNSDSLFNMISVIGESDIILSSVREYDGVSYKEYIINNVNTRNIQETTDWLTVFNHFIILTVPWSKLLKTSIINNYKLRFDVRFCSGEDSLFLYKYLCYVDKVTCIDRISYNYSASRGLSNKLLSLKEIDSILQEIIFALRQLSKKFSNTFVHSYYNSLEYFIIRYDFSNKKFNKFYKDFLYLSKQKYFSDLINDKVFIPKGRKRKLFDFLFKHKLYIILALWVYKGKKLYF